jgi:hypothetical protein
VFVAEVAESLFSPLLIEMRYVYAYMLAVLGGKEERYNLARLKKFCISHHNQHDEQKDAVADGAQLNEESNLKTNNAMREESPTKPFTSGFLRYSLSGSGGLRYIEQHRVTKCRITKPSARTASSGEEQRFREVQKDLAERLPFVG